MFYTVKYAPKKLEDCIGNKEKIEHIWEEAFPLLEAQPEQTEYTIKSQYQEVRKVPIFGKKQKKILANVILKNRYR